jgi:hypothetical protein
MRRTMGLLLFFLEIPDYILCKTTGPCRLPYCDDSNGTISSNLLDDALAATVSYCSSAAVSEANERYDVEATVADYLGLCMYCIDLKI